MWAASKVEGSTHSRTLPSGGFYPAGGLQWRFNSGFDLNMVYIGICGHFCGPEGVVSFMIAICSRFCGPGGVVNGFCGNYGSLLAWDGPFQAVGLSFW